MNTPQRKRANAATVKPMQHLSEKIGLNRYSATAPYATNRVRRKSVQKIRALCSNRSFTRILACVGENSCLLSAACVPRGGSQSASIIVASLSQRRVITGCADRPVIPAIVQQQAHAGQHRERQDHCHLKRRGTWADQVADCLHRQDEENHCHERCSDGPEQCPGADGPLTMQVLSI